MPGHNEIYERDNSPWSITDPGSSQALPSDQSGIINIVSTGAETRTLAAPVRAGLRLAINFLTDGGDVTITVASSIGLVSRTTIVLADAGQYIILESRAYGTGFRWVVTSEAGGGAALTAQLTSITIADAAGTPDYAIQAVINSSAYGFASAAEAITFLYVVQNLQVRVAELEARLEGAGVVKAN